MNFITSNYDDASGMALTVAADMGQSINTGTLALAFLDWSAHESGYGTNTANIAENNYFGAQNKNNVSGIWNGAAVPCPRDGNPIPIRSQNACFAASYTWGDQLQAILNSPSGSTRVTYLSALESGLSANPNESVAAIMQSIANNGYNGRAYGRTIAGGVGATVKTLLDCLKKNGYVQ